MSTTRIPKTYSPADKLRAKQAKDGFVSRAANQVGSSLADRAAIDSVDNAVKPQLLKIVPTMMAPVPATPLDSLATMTIRREPRYVPTAVPADTSGTVGINRAGAMAEAIARKDRSTIYHLLQELKERDPTVDLPTHDEIQSVVLNPIANPVVQRLCALAAITGRTTVPENIDPPLPPVPEASPGFEQPEKEISGSLIVLKADSNPPQEQYIPPSPPVDAATLAQVLLSTPYELQRQLGIHIKARGPPRVRPKASHVLEGLPRKEDDPYVGKAMAAALDAMDQMLELDPKRFYSEAGGKLSYLQQQGRDNLRGWCQRHDVKLVTKKQRGSWATAEFAAAIREHRKQALLDNQEAEAEQKRGERKQGRSEKKGSKDAQTERFDILAGEISAGNDSPAVKKELRSIIRAMCAKGSITTAQRDDFEQEFFR